MFVFSARTFLFMACVLISLKITFFNPCHPLCGLCCSFLPKQKKNIPLPHEGTIEGNIEWEHKKIIEILHTTNSNSKGKKIEPKIKQTKNYKYKMDDNKIKTFI